MLNKVESAKARGGHESECVPIRKRIEHGIRSSMKKFKNKVETALSLSSGFDRLSMCETKSVEKDYHMSVLLQNLNWSCN
jgi:hypothetical protein